MYSSPGLADCPPSWLHNPFLAVARFGTEVEEEEEKKKRRSGVIQVWQGGAPLIG